MGEYEPGPGKRDGPEQNRGVQRPNQRNPDAHNRGGWRQHESLDAPSPGPGLGLANRYSGKGSLGSIKPCVGHLQERPAVLIQAPAQVRARKQRIVDGSGRAVAP